MNGIKGPSWLTFFPKFDIVNGIAIDYMHGVLLGIQKLLLNLWFSDSHKSKPFSFYNKLVVVEQRLSGIKPTLTISRLPRSIHNELKYWKASDFRAFLLFYGAAVLNGILDNERFVHYLLLVNSIFILLKDGSQENDIVEAENMLFEFVKHFSALYDKCYMTLNIHQLLHLPDSVRLLGPLYTHSCFSFEDKNGVLLKMIRGTQNIDNQIITGVSFLQKLPELKNTAIIKDSHIEDLYNSIEHPNILTRGVKLSDDVYILGALKTKKLTDTEHNALYKCLGYAPSEELIRYFKRLEFHNSLIYGTTYSRMTKRDNSAICFKYADQHGTTELFGKVQYFILLDDLTAYAVTEELKCKNYCKQHILAVEKTDRLVIVKVACLLKLVRARCTTYVDFPIILNMIKKYSL